MGKMKEYYSHEINDFKEMEEMYNQYQEWLVKQEEIEYEKHLQYEAEKAAMEECLGMTNSYPF
jgi:hypothetical protein